MYSTCPDGSYLAWLLAAPFFAEFAANQRFVVVALWLELCALENGNDYDCFDFTKIKPHYTDRE